MSNMINVVVKSHVCEFNRNGDTFYPGDLVKLPAVEADLQIKNETVRPVDDLELARLEDLMSNRPAELLDRRTKDLEKAQNDLEKVKSKNSDQAKEVMKLKDQLAKLEAKAKKNNR